MKWSFLFFLIATAMPASALRAQDSQFEKLLKKNEAYKNVVEKFDSQVGAVSTNQDMTKLNSAIDAYIAEKESGNKSNRLDLVDSAMIDQSDCSTCPSYLGLSDDVSKVLAKLKKADDVSLANQIGLGLNNLKFLYYTVKYELVDGSIDCRKFGNIHHVSHSLEGSLTVKSENLIDIPNMESVQYIPEGGKEVIYLYRGSGAQRNTLVEVHMLPNNKAIIRYFNYRPSAAEILLEKEMQKSNLAVDLIKKLKAKPEKTPEPEGPYLDISPSLKMRDGVVPTDIELVRAKAKAEIAEGLNLQTKTAISYNQQVAEVALTGSEGKDWVKVNATNNTLGTKEIVTVIPMTVTIDESAKLNLNGNVKNETLIAPKASDDPKSDLKATNAQTVSLSLTDHNSKYLELELYQRQADKYSKVSASSELKSDALGKVTAKFSTDSAGERAFSLGKVTDMGGYGKLTTEFGGTQTSNGQKSFVALQHEVELSKSSSLAVTAKTNSDRQVTTMFQFKAKF